MYHNVIGLVVLSCVPIVVDSDELVGKKKRKEERDREKERKKGERWARKGASAWRDLSVKSEDALPVPCAENHGASSTFRRDDPLALPPGPIVFLRHNLESR